MRHIGEILGQLGVAFDFNVVRVMHKDSLHKGPEDRAVVRSTIEQHAGRMVVVINGPDTVVDTTKALAGIEGKVVVLTGALNPARFQGCATNGPTVP